MADSAIDYVETHDVGGFNGDRLVIPPPHSRFPSGFGPGVEAATETIIATTAGGDHEVRKLIRQVI
jgi:hypothetical protein